MRLPGDFREPNVFWDGFVPAPCSLMTLPPVHLTVSRPWSCCHHIDDALHQITVTERIKMMAHRCASHVRATVALPVGGFGDRSRPASARFRLPPPEAIMRRRLVLRGYLFL